MTGKLLLSNLKKYMNQLVDLSIVIVSFNTKDILQDCLISVFSNKPKNLTIEVIVVDNASADGSLEMIRKDFPKVLLIENKENLGFSKANNIGVRRSKGRYVLFLNSDTIVFKGTIETMIEFMNSYLNAGAATCKVVLPNEKLDDASHRGFPTPWNALCHFSGLSKLFPASRTFSGYSLGYMDQSLIHEIDACAGAFMMVRREAGDQIGWWDEDFFWYGDDLDFCYRLKQKDWKIYFVPTASILHYKGVSGGIKDISKNLTKADAKTKALATYARFEAMKIFYQKHYKHKYPEVVTWLVMKGINLRAQFSGKIYR